MSEYQDRAARLRDKARLWREARDRPIKLESGELIELVTDDLVEQQPDDDDARRLLARIPDSVTWIPRTS